MPSDISVRRSEDNPASGWFSLAGVLIAIAVALPLIAIVVLALRPQDNIWPHLAATVLPGYVWRTALLLAGVGVLTICMGTLTAWLVAMHEFPLCRYFQWASLLPLAMPVYITSYTYVAFLNYSGPVQTTAARVVWLGQPAGLLVP